MMILVWLRSCRPLLLAKTIRALNREPEYFILAAMLSVNVVITGVDSVCCLGLLWRLHSSRWRQSVQSLATTRNRFCSSSINIGRSIGSVSPHITPSSSLMQSAKKLVTVCITLTSCRKINAKKMTLYLKFIYLPYTINIHLRLLW